MWNTVLLRSLNHHQQRLAAAAVATAAAGFLTSEHQQTQEGDATVDCSPAYYPHYYTLAEKQNIPKPNDKDEEETLPNIYDPEKEGEEEGDEEEDEEELPPWWGTRLTRRLTRHFTRQMMRGDGNIPTDDGSHQSAVETSTPSNPSELFHGQCLKRQMRTPAVPYPAWDYNWDGRMTQETSLEGHRAGKASSANVYNKTRHIILVRHGQYDEYPRDDVNRRLTPLGRKQAIKTGQRLANMAKGSYRFKEVATRGPCPIKVIRVSNMRRAKETAELIAQEMRRQHLPHDVTLEEPDEDLNEALPAPMLPIRPELSWATEEIDIHKDRVEQTFQKYFFRDAKESTDEEEDEEEQQQQPDEEQDEFEIIVCHGNVIRYFFCRALQLPPEAWLRLSLFNCSLTYLMIRPNGMVTARMLGDIGHLDYEETTFSSNYGFKW